MHSPSQQGLNLSPVDEDLEDDDDDADEFDDDDGDDDEENEEAEDVDTWQCVWDSQKCS